MQVVEFLKRISEASGVSGAEVEVAAIVAEALGEFADEVRSDALGNVVALKRGEGLDAGEHPRIMLAGHMDEIGLMVSKVDQGFLRVTTVGGFDVRTLLGQEVTVHGRRKLAGVIGSRPPHVLEADERQRVVPVKDLFVDVGQGEATLADLVQVGDVVTIRRQPVDLAHGHLAGKAFDDRVSVAAIAGCLQMLARRRHSWDVYAVATTQEEVGLRGATVSAYGVAPQLAIALDATFAIQNGVGESQGHALGGGPTIGLGANFHPKVHERLVETAKAHEIPYGIESEPGRSGTDAWAIQVSREGIPTALVSIPVRNMHTPVETLATRDLERAARLLTEFIAELDGAFAQELAVQVTHLNGQGGQAC